MYKLDITKAAGKFLEQLPAKQFRQVGNVIFRLRETPEPHDSQSLSGAPEYRRVDIGEYRIIYRVEDDTVYIAVIGKRNDDDVYRQFKRGHS